MRSDSNRRVRSIARWYCPIPTQSMTVEKERPLAHAFPLQQRVAGQSTCGVRRRADREASLGSGGPAVKTLRLNALFQVRQRCKSATAVHGPATHRDRQRRLGPAQPRSPAPTTWCPIRIPRWHGYRAASARAVRALVEYLAEAERSGVVHFAMNLRVSDRPYMDLMEELAAHILPRFPSQTAVDVARTVPVETRARHRQRVQERL